MFFKKALSSQISKAYWAPRIISMEELVKQYTSYQTPDKLSQVFALYPVYQKVTGMKEAFEQFYFWGDMLVGDFDDLDKYKVPAKKLFTGLKNQKEIDLLFGDFTEEQRELMKVFWGNFEERQSSQKQSFLTIWRHLYEVYEQYQEALKARGWAYDGMVYREVAEKLEEGTLVPTDEQLIFAGFNALTTTEEMIISWFCQERKARVYWDTDAYYMERKSMEAGNFLREYARQTLLGQTFPKTLPRFLEEGKREVHLLTCPDMVSQLKHLGEQLEQLAAKPGWKPEKTAVVLADESLLLGTLQAIPDNIPLVNVTMGYPVRQSQVYSLLEHLLELQQRKQVISGELRFHHASVIPILEHALVFPYLRQEDVMSIREMKRNNQIWMTPDTFSSTITQLIFQDIALPQVFTYLKEIVKQVEQVEDPLQKQLNLYLYQQLNRLEAIFAQAKGTELSWKGLYALMRTMLRNVRVPFSGEPLNGLQIMGVLETRNLDFEHVFFISASEEYFPGRPAMHSYIPYNLRKAFDLPGIDQHDAIYSYLFYRLLQRAETVQFFYPAQQEDGKAGEPSHYIQQLLYESGWPIQQKTLSSKPEIPAAVPLSIEKDEELMQRLQDRLLLDENGNVGYRLSPTAVNDYLSCRLRFYFKYIANIQEPDEVEEDIDNALFGNILHHALELIYTPYLRKSALTTEQIQELREKVPTIVEESFKHHFGVREEQPFEMQGHYGLIYELVCKVVLRILEIDEQEAPFTILALEGKRDYEVNLPVEVKGQTRHIGLKGIIDRIDEKEDAVRVVDYKSGKDEKIFKELEKLFLRDSGDRKSEKPIFQLFYYATQYNENFKLPAGKRLEAGLYNLKELFQEDFDYRISANHEAVDNIAPLLPEFKERLIALLQEIFDTEQPFDQTTKTDHCKYCPYIRVCQRDS